MVDAHCHLQDSRFDESRHQKIQTARDAGVEAFICNATSPADWNGVATLAQTQQGVIPAFGVHPWFGNHLSSHWEEELCRYLDDFPEASCGEIGLDFAQEGADRTQQIAVFRSQCALAHEMARPVSIHCRKAWQELLITLKQFPRREGKGIVHAWAGSVEVAREIIKLGYTISFGTALIDPGHKKAERTCREIAPHSFVIETDAPDMAPKGCTVNDPVNLCLVRDACARIRNESPDSIDSMTTQTAHRIFVS